MPFGNVHLVDAPRPWISEHARLPGIEIIVGHDRLRVRYTLTYEIVSPRVDHVAVDLHNLALTLAT
jgi:hypothetical protein